MRLLIGIGLILGSWLSVVAERYELKLPTVSWGFNLSRMTEELAMPAEWLTWFFERLGWFVAGGVGLVGIWLVVSYATAGVANPITVRKIQRFKAIKRGYYSFLILLFLAGLAALDQVLVGNEALAVKTDGKWQFPAFTVKNEKYRDFGVTDPKLVDQVPDYRKMKVDYEEERKGKVILPLWPFNPTQDTVNALAKKIDPGADNYSGLATRLYDTEKPDEPHLRYSYRDGVRQYDAQGWDRNNERVYKALYEDGKIVEGSVEWSGEGSLEDFLAASPEQEYDVSYPPSDPQFWRHPLGTTSQGDDMIAYIYGGLQVNFQAALIYIPIVYAVGITVGLLMGFFGGWFDLIVQRLIEVLTNIPFLFLVIIVTLGVPAQYKDRVGFYLILMILAAFGWMGMTNLMRTAALKEKARDYIAASRVIGAGTTRILFRHLMPNTVAILVTLIPFSVSGLVLSLTALDYLGFGLPVQYATWGKLLKGGIESLSSPWIVTSAFLSLVVLLVLVTFIGEAIREAFDPKKYTYYR